MVENKLHEVLAKIGQSSGVQLHSEVRAIALLVVRTGDARIRAEKMRGRRGKIPEPLVSDVRSVPRGSEPLLLKSTYLTTSKLNSHSRFNFNRCPEAHNRHFTAL